MTNDIQPTQQEIAPLSDRQTKILRAIVSEYCETALPVGSETLDKKYQVGYSPATIRNEMSRLTEKGFLSQPHASAGRTPTPKAFKFYVSKLMEEKQLSVTDEVKVKQQVWDARGEVGRLLREATRVLASQTHLLAMAATDQGKSYCSGYANILDIPEFFDIDLTKHVLSMLDQVEALMEMFNRDQSEEPLHILIGDDFEDQAFMPVGMVYTKFSLGGTTGALGVLGPVRLDYSYIRPAVRYIGDLLNQIGREW